MRALIGRPKILVLDEATASLDKETKSHVVNLINLLKTEMIILQITHDPKVASKVDHVFVLEKGEIKKEGAPNELLKSPSTYSSIFAD